MRHLNRHALIVAFGIVYLTGCSQSPPPIAHIETVPSTPVQTPDASRTSDKGSPKVNNISTALNPIATAASSTPPVSAPIEIKKYNGPFGLSPGMTLAQAQEIIPNLTHRDGTFYGTNHVPTPHMAFESYVLWFSTQSGLCAITAIGKDINSGATGAEVQDIFNNLSAAISERYGTGKEYNFTTGMMSDPKYWMLALSNKDRTLEKYWTKDTGASFPTEISGIIIKANASDMSTGYVTLRYEYTNRDDCEAENNLITNKAL